MLTRDESAEPFRMIGYNYKTVELLLDPSDNLGREGFQSPEAHQR